MNTVIAKFPLETPESVGKRIALLRKEMNLTQYDLAYKLDVSRSLIASIESGMKSPDLRLWTQLALFFGVSADYIAGTSTDRTFKTLNTGSTKLDLNLLNEHGLHILYTHYEYLVSQPEYRKK